MDEIRSFGEVEEKAIISLILDSPQFFHQICAFMTPEAFNEPETRVIFQVVKELYNQHEVVPPRGILIDQVLKSLTTDDDFQPILDLLNRKTDPREVPIIKQSITDWARDRAFGLIYSEDAIKAYENKEYVKLQQIVESAERITQAEYDGVWFFNSLDQLFTETVEDKLTVGIPKLDSYINEGGPTKKEVFVWMAPTGVGKTLMLVHSGLANVKRGMNVLHVTLETSKVKIMQRYSGAISNVPTSDRFEHRTLVENSIRKFHASYTGDLVIYEFPPDEITVDTIHQLIQYLKKSKGWAPDVVIVDYLELLKSRQARSKDDEYKSQKRSATELRGLAGKENVLVFTATQTNRNLDVRDKDKGGGMIGLDKIAESYGKAMPLDYIVSMNQTPEEYTNGKVTFFIAKNRNGPKFKSVGGSINYKTMRVQEDRGVVLK